MSTFNLSELTTKIANENTVQLDGGLAQYVKSSIEILQSQGKDITKYTLTQIHNPMQIKEDGRIVTSVWKIIKMSDLSQLKGEK
jgi:hypothetical protein